RRELQSFSRGR
ncbi:response regulator, partial [Vibrio parahaemolyticus V-223/04]